MVAARVHSSPLSPRCQAGLTQVPLPVPDFKIKPPPAANTPTCHKRHARFYSERPPPALFRSSSGNFLSVFTERCGAVRSRRKGFSPLTPFVCAAPLRALTAGLTRGAGVGDGSTPWERERQGEKPLFFCKFYMVEGGAEYRLPRVMVGVFRGMRATRGRAHRGDPGRR